MTAFQDQWLLTPTYSCDQWMVTFIQNETYYNHLFLWWKKICLLSGWFSNNIIEKCYLCMRAPAAWPNSLTSDASSSETISGCEDREGWGAWGGGVRGNSHFCLSSHDFRVLSNAWNKHTHADTEHIVVQSSFKWNSCQKATKTLFVNLWVKHFC